MLRTYDAWRELGFQVQKGSKAVKRRGNGTPLFSREQVKPRHKVYTWNDSTQEYDNSDYEFDRDFRDVEFYDRDWG